MSYFLFISRFTLLLVFAAALAGKLHNRAAWANFVTATSELLGARRTAAAWAIGATLSEGLTVCGLAVDRFARVGLVFALLELTAFLLVVLGGVIRGVRTSCNCFGADGSSIGWTHVWRNLMLVAIAAVGTAASMVSDMPSTFVGAAYATPIVLSIIAATVFVAWDDVGYLVVGSSSHG